MSEAELTGAVACALALLAGCRPPLPAAPLWTLPPLPTLGHLGSGTAGLGQWLPVEVDPEQVARAEVAALLDAIEAGLSADLAWWEYNTAEQLHVDVDMEVEDAIAWLMDQGFAADCRALIGAVA